MTLDMVLDAAGSENDLPESLDENGARSVARIALRGDHALARDSPIGRAAPGTGPGPRI